MLLVMGLLFRDVLRNHTNAGFTHAENSISGLPRKSRTVFLPHPPRRIRLDHAHNLRWRMNRSHTHQHVNMIGHSIHDQCDTAHLANNPAEIGEQTIAEFCLYQRPSPLSRKNQMQQNISRRMRHCLSPLRGLSSFLAADPRLTAWAALFRRFAAAISAVSDCARRRTKNAVTDVTRKKEERWKSLDSDASARAANMQTQPPRRP